MNRIFVFLGCLFALSGCLNEETNTQNVRNNGDFIGPHQVPDPEIRFGLVWDSLVVDSGRVKEGQSLSHILNAYEFGSGKVATLAANTKHAKGTCETTTESWHGFNSYTHFVSNATPHKNNSHNAII